MQKQMTFSEFKADPTEDLIIITDERLEFETEDMFSPRL